MRLTGVVKALGAFGFAQRAVWVDFGQETSVKGRSGRCARCCRNGYGIVKGVEPMGSDATGGRIVGWCRSNQKNNAFLCLTSGASKGTGADQKGVC